MLRRLSRWYRATAPEIPARSNMSSNPFPEEPLNLTEEQGFGFFPARLGMLLNDSRYEVQRKLGTGGYSSTWLVSDSQAETPKYYAIKILTAHATKGHHDGHVLELEAMQAVTASNSLQLPRLYNHFEIDGPHGRHFCLVSRVLSENVNSFRRTAPSKSLDVPKVKIIVAEVLKALIQLHTTNLIHTDVKADNVLFSDGTAPQTIKELLDKSPQVIDGEFELKGAHYPIMRSQPIPNPFLWSDPPITVEFYSLCLTDLGSAQWVGKKPSTRTIGAYALRAPEVILGANYGVKVDIWALGCMAFELLTGRWLFNPQAGETWRIEDDHLAKMAELTGDNFSDRILVECRKRDEYFDETGKLRRIDQLFPMTLERAMMNYGIAEADATAAGFFVRACLHLDPDERPSASELDEHPWLENAYMCC